MRFTWIVPTYNEEKVIREKLSNIIDLLGDNSIFGDSEVIVADNGSVDATVDLAKSFPHVKVLELGRVGKYSAIHEALATCDSDWTILSDANVMVRRVEEESLRAILHDDAVGLVYGIIRRASRAFDSSLTFPVVPKPKRFLLDEFFGCSSGAYGGLYAVRTPILKTVLTFPPVQNDDYFIAVSSSEHGKPKIGEFYGEEVEAMTFCEEFSRKLRDAQGHLSAMIEISRRIKSSRVKNYAVAIRSIIWTCIVLFVVLNVYLILLNPWLSLILAVSLSIEKVRVLYGRCLGLIVGFFSGPFIRKKIVWDTLRK